MDEELNEFLETNCVRCDKGTCDCSEQSQELPPIAPVIDDDYIDNLNDWD